MTEDIDKAEQVLAAMISIVESGVKQFLPGWGAVLMLAPTTEAQGDTVVWSCTHGEKAGETLVRMMLDQTVPKRKGEHDV